MAFDAKDNFVAGRINLPTALSSREIANQIPVNVRAHSFFSARIAEGHVLDAIREISDAYTNGEIDFATARMRIRQLGAANGGDPGSNRIDNLASKVRAELILQQNALMAAAVGQYEVERDPDIMAAYPYWQYHINWTGTSEQNRDEHRKYDGAIFAKTDPIWRSLYPPSKFNCHCGVESITSAEAKQRGGVWASNGVKIPKDPSGFEFDPETAFKSVDPNLIDNPDWRDKSVSALQKEFPVKPDQSVGTAVSDALDVRVNDKTLRAEVDEAINAINSVHGDGKLTPTPVIGRSPGKDALGAYMFYLDRVAGIVKPEIRILATGDYPALTTAHEIGHMLDFDALGSKGISAAATGDIPEMAEWRSAVKNTDAYRQLLTIKGKHAAYLRKPEELFARSYAQYIAVKSKSEILKKQLEKSRSSIYNDMYHAQWSDDDFAPVMDALTKLLKAKGWIS